jgi:hypothetical protein
MNVARFLLLTPLAPLLLGCSSMPFEPADTCLSSGMTLNATRRVACSGVDAMVQRSQAAAVGRGLFTEDEFQGVVAGLTAWLWPDAEAIPESPCAEASGCVLFGRAEVYLADHGASFTHELMHRLDERRGVSNDDNKRHLGWGQRGAAAGAQAHVCQSWAEPPCLDGSWEDVAFSARVEQAFDGVTEGL